MIGKLRILRFIECARLPYFDVRGESAPGGRIESPAALLRRAEGCMLGERARREFPGGKLIGGKGFADASRETARALSAGTEVLFEAAFAHGSLAARPDILAREGNERWRLWEVKSGTDLKEEYLIDVAAQVLVLERAGMIVRPGLFLVDKTATTESPTIFRRVECEADVRERIPTIRTILEEMERVLSASKPPDATLERRCRDCEYTSTCWPDLPTPSVLDLYQGRGGWRHVDALLRSGIVDLRQVSSDSKLTELQRRQVEAARSGLTVVDRKRCGEFLRSLRHPLHFLDFEAARFPIPEFPGQHPYDLIPFQWSCHVEESPGAPLRHLEFLSDRPGDPRRPLAESLILGLGRDGNIIVYSSFEQEALRSLARELPDLAPDLELIERRLSDLLPVVRKGFYHPSFGSSFSVKSVLPVLALESGYDRLVIGEGLAAVWAYYRLVHENLPEEERRSLAGDLLAYCEQDSKALHAIHRALAREVDHPPV